MATVGISLTKMIADAERDPAAVTVLATSMAKEWCEQWGGWPADTLERMEQIWAFRPAARKALAAMKRPQKVERRTLASAIAA